MLATGLVMKNRFRECMRAMYPAGVTNQHQHRDLARVFFYAWCESLLAADHLREVNELLEEYEAIRDPNWWPDESW